MMNQGYNRTSSSTTTENSSNTNSSNSSNSTNNADAGWKTVTKEFSQKITSSDGDIYYQGYSFSFQIKGDSSATMFVVPDSLYNSKFFNYAYKSTIKIKYRSGTAKADNGVTYPINIVTDVKEA